MTSVTCKMADETENVTLPSRASALLLDVTIAPKSEAEHFVGLL